MGSYYSVKNLILQQQSSPSIMISETLPIKYVFVLWDTILRDKIPAPRVKFNSDYLVSCYFSELLSHKYFKNIMKRFFFL